MGVPGDEALSLFHDLGQRIAVATAEPRSFQFLMHRLRVAIQLGNAACINMELCPLLLAGTNFFTFSIDTFVFNFSCRCSELCALFQLNIYIYIYRYIYIIYQCIYIQLSLMGGKIKYPQGISHIIPPRIKRNNFLFGRWWIIFQKCHFRKVHSNFH